MGISSMHMLHPKPCCTDLASPVRCAEIARLPCQTCAADDLHTQYRHRGDRRVGVGGPPGSLCVGLDLESVEEEAKVVEEEDVDDL
jgi:hypothetical protein